MNKIDYNLESKERIDKLIHENLKDKKITRATIEEWIENGLVFANKKKINKKNHLLIGKGEITIKKEKIENKIDNIDLEPEKLDLEIIYEDEHLIIVNKESGIVVHPSIGHSNGTLLNGIIYHTNNKILDLKENKNDTRPGVIHRLDKDTSGLIIFAKTKNAMIELNEMMKKRDIKKFYYALVKPKLEYDKGVIDAPIGRDSKNRQKMAVTDFNSKEASSYFEIKERSANWELVNVELITGRTHQIRVHFNFINHPIINDPVYGDNIKKADSYGQYLQAWKLEFNHPITKQLISLEIPLDNKFKLYMKNN